MSNWIKTLATALHTWWTSRHVKRVSKTVADEVYPELWESVRRKISAGMKQQAELHDYAKVRATQLTHQRVDALVRSDPALSGAFANRVILKSSELAVRSVIAAAASAKSSSAN